MMARLKAKLLSVASALDELAMRYSAVVASDGCKKILGASHVGHSADEVLPVPQVNSGPTFRFSVPTTCNQDGLRDIALGITLAFAYPYLSEMEVAQLFEVFDGCLDSIRDDLDMSQSEVTIRVSYVNLSTTHALMCLIVNSLGDALAERVVWISADELKVEDEDSGRQSASVLHLWA